MHYMSNPDDLALDPQALPAAPEDPAEQLQWLVDRAMISEILTRLLTRIDSRDYRGVAELFTDDGVVVLPFASYPVDELPEISEQLFAPFEATHHMIGNVAITIDRDRAHSRQYLLASHIPRRDEPALHADVGGWYDYEYRRTAAGWRITRYALTFVYTDGIPFEPHV